MCRRFLADSEDFSEENIAKAGITRRFSNNGELEDCISEVKSAILGGMYGY
jgi:guanylate kinase